MDLKFEANIDCFAKKGLWDYVLSRTAEKIQLFGTVLDSTHHHWVCPHHLSNSLLLLYNQKWPEQTAIYCQVGWRAPRLEPAFLQEPVLLLNQE